MTERREGGDARAEQRGGFGGGLLLLSRFLGKPTIEVANELLGNTPERSRAPVYRSFVSEDQIRKANHEQARKGAEALLASSELRPHPYMSDRGLDGQWLVNGEPIMGKDRVVINPGELMLVPAYKADGDGSKLVNVQKIKANKEKRPLFGGDMTGVYHKLDGHQKLIAITEGYATGVTVNQVTGATTYVAFQTGNLASVSAWVTSQYPGAPVVFSAHGVPKSVPAAATARHMFQLDATCPLVSKVHRQAERQIEAGRHIVFIAAEEAYRSEESMPVMAGILSRQGFKCTVLFAIDPFVVQIVLGALILWAVGINRFREVRVARADAAQHRAFDAGAQQVEDLGGCLRAA